MKNNKNKKKKCFLNTCSESKTNVSMDTIFLSAKVYKFAEVYHIVSPKQICNISYNKFTTELLFLSRIFTDL